MRDREQRGWASLEIPLPSWLAKRPPIWKCRCNTEPCQGEGNTKPGADSVAGRFRRRVIFRQEIAPSAYPGLITIHLVNVTRSS